MGEWRVREGDNRIEELISASGHIQMAHISGHLDQVHEGADLGVSFNNRGEVSLNPRYRNGDTTVGLGLNIAPDMARQIAQDLESAADAAEENR